MLEQQQFLSRRRASVDNNSLDHLRVIKIAKEKALRNLREENNNVHQQQDEEVRREKELILKLLEEEVFADDGK